MLYLYIVVISVSVKWYIGQQCYSSIILYNITNRTYNHHTDIYPLLKKNIYLPSIVKEMAADMAEFGLRGVFRGQAIGIGKAVVSLSLFHEGRMFLARQFKASNEAAGKVPK